MGIGHHERGRDYGNNKNKDCSSNVCEMIYDNGRPKGRFCLENTSEN